MPVKSIIEISIDDKNFQNYLKTYKQYQQSLKAMPSAWKQINQQMNGTVISFRGLVAEMVAATVKQKLLLQAQERADQITKTTAERWREMAGSAKTFASHIADSTRSMLRWVTAGSVIGGLLGLGGLYGLERLGGSVAGGRRSSLGLGLSYGQQRAFELNFGRVVEPRQVLGGVNEALNDVTKRYTLYGAGLSEQEIAGRNTAEVSTLLLSHLKKLADQTPESQLGNVLSARGLGQFLTLQDFIRLRNTSGSELGGLFQSYGADVRTLGLNGGQQRAWQDFTTQLSRAGEQIENVFARRLPAILPGIEDLSKSVIKVVENLDSDRFNAWLKSIGTGIETFAKYVGSGDFQDNVKAFATSVADIGDQLGSWSKWLDNHLPKIQLGSFDPHIVPGGPIDRFRRWIGNTVGAFTGDSNASRHNPGGLRLPGQSSGFASFPSDEAGVSAIAKQLLLYQDRDHLDTISGIVNKYAPSNENDVAAYIKSVTQRTGYGADQHLNLHDKDTLSKVVSAITNKEGVRYFNPGATKVIIENNTGGNVNVTATQLTRSP